MKRYLLTWALLSCAAVPNAFGWGELGHQLIGRTAAKILGQHPLLAHRSSSEERARIASFVGLMRSRRLMEGHLANIPDIFWRNLDQGLEEDGQLLGDAAHFLNAESYLAVSPKTILGAADFLKLGIPLSFSSAEKKFSSLSPNQDFFKTGTLPWRAQQFATLYYWTLTHATELDSLRASALAAGKTAVPPPATEIALAYAGLMSHLTGDASQPYHVTSDYDGEATGQKGIHSYFETALVDALEEDSLALDVEKEARQRLTAKEGEATVAELHQLVSKFYPGADNDEALIGGALPGLTEVGKTEPKGKAGTGERDAVTALTLALVGDSYSNIPKVQSLDETYALATFAEAREDARCKHLPQMKRLEARLADADTDEQKQAILATRVKSPVDGKGHAPQACRRSPFASVDDSGNRQSGLRGKKVADRFHSLVVTRIAVAAALTADIWARLYLQAGAPKLGFTFQYALKPSFVSPTDAKCAGYATDEDPARFMKKDHSSALPFRKSPASTDGCVSF